MSRSAAAVLTGKEWAPPVSPGFSQEMGWRQPFTVSQWRELEHQALIFKYMIAGVPVPPDLLIPIHKSFESVSSRFYNNLPARDVNFAAVAAILFFGSISLFIWRVDYMRKLFLLLIVLPLSCFMFVFDQLKTTDIDTSPLGYFSYYGKKLDPEPGRCRRTDGKKWRCSKDAHADSKYCERHMHRSRNRSRKHVESKNNLSQQESESNFSSSSNAAHVALSNIGSFQNNKMQFSMEGASKPQGLCSGSSGSSPLQSGAQDYGIGSKEFRCLHDSTKIEVDERNFFSRYPGNIQTGIIPSQIPTFPFSKEKKGPLNGLYLNQLQSIQDINEVTIRSISKQQDQHHSYFNSDFDLAVPMKQDCQGFGQAFNEWPKVKESWLGLEDGNSKQISFSATQLSMSIPMSSSDFSTTTCCSPNDD